MLSDFQDYPFPYIPKTITVHLGAPDEEAANVTVPFADYIKNVASSEIYPTWPVSAIRANVLAEISFALNRIFTDYYPSRGYPFQITSSTAYDQSFVDGRNYYDTISTVVDNVFNSYIRRQGRIEPLFALYCDGRKVTCDGLSQWGTVELAEEGLNSVEILKRYYGDDIEIVTNAPVASLSDTPPSRLLRLGVTGNDVLAVQIRLNRIATDFPSIPKIPDPDGFFDVETRDAVTEFQSVFGLDADGVVGPATWYKIEQIYAAVKRLNDVRSEGITYSEIPAVYPRLLSLGDSGDAVRFVQYMLNYAAEYEDAIPPFPITGEFDEATREAVIGFQIIFGLEKTGVVNKETYDRLFDFYYALIRSLPPSLFEDVARPFPGIDLGPGFDLPEVSYLQDYLTVIASFFPEVPDPGNSGVYDETTEATVRSVQALAGLPVTGIVDLNTWDAIASLYNDIRSGSLIRPDQYPGYLIE